MCSTEVRDPRPAFLIVSYLLNVDGEWISVVIDDYLCLKHGDENEKHPTEVMLKVSGDKRLLNIDLTQDSYAILALPKKFRESLRKGSKSLFFSSCSNENETWLPLLEKA